MFTKEELELIKNMLMNYPIQGTMASLPEIMGKLLGIIKKIEEMEKDAQ